MVKWGRFGYARHPRQGVDVIHGCTGEVGAPVPVEARVVVQGGNTGQTVCRAVVASGKGGSPQPGSAPLPAHSHTGPVRFVPSFGSASGLIPHLDDDDVTPLLPRGDVIA